MSAQLSVIIPIYNMASSLEVALEALSQQIFTDFEIIIIDDGSQDQPKLIVDKFLSIKPKIYYYQQDNKGVSAARNRGLQLCKTPFINFMDADDCIAPNYFSNVMDGYNSEDIIITGITKIQNNQKEVLQFPFSGTYNRVDFFENIIKIQMDTGLLGFVSNKIFRKDIIEKNNLKFNEDLKLCEDLDFFMRYYQYCNTFLISPESGNFYCYQPKSSDIDYLSLINIFLGIKEILLKNKFYSKENAVILEDYIQELKYALFNEEKNPSIEFLIKNTQSLKAINWKKTKDFNKKVIRTLAKKEHFTILKNYLLLRKTYIQMRTK